MEPINSLTLQFLHWISSRPRTYAETMEAWRTACPRLSIWEDSLADRLVQVEYAQKGAARVSLTERGRAYLRGLVPSRT